MRYYLTSKNIHEVNGVKETETNEKEFKKEIAKQILRNLIEKRQEVTVDEVLYFLHWAEDTGNYSEDVAVVVENWLQESDNLIIDEFAYYKQMMETPIQ